MKIQILLSTLLGAAAWSLSGVAVADWNSGPCPQPHTGPAPCIETEMNGNTYHFDDGDGHAGIWYPTPEGGGDFEFTSDSVILACSGFQVECLLALSAEVKKCQDSNGDWRIGLRMNSADVEAGDFACNLVALGGFPWYSKDSSITPHCPFTDDCDTFIPYDPSASTYTANYGPIDINFLGSPEVVDGHVHGAVFTPGAGANFAFSSDFFDCAENMDCSVDGILTLDNATSLYIY